MKKIFVLVLAVLLVSNQVIAGEEKKVPTGVITKVTELLGTSITIIKNGIGQGLTTIQTGVKQGITGGATFVSNHKLACSIATAFVVGYFVTKLALKAKCPFMEKVTGCCSSDAKKECGCPSESCCNTTN